VTSIAAEQSRWTLTCMLCETFTDTSVTAIHQHAVDVHQVSRDDIRRAGRNPVRVGEKHFNYALPDGRPWLDARKG